MNKANIPGIHVPAKKVLRYLGYPALSPARKDVQDVFLRAMEVGPPLLKPAACYDVVHIKSIASDAVYLEGGVSFNSRDLALRLRGAKEAALLIVTVGEELEEEVDRRFQNGESASAYMLDILASTAVACLVRNMKSVIEDHVRSKGYHAMTHGVCLGKKCPVYRDCGGAVIHWWSPGYGDWSVLENKKVFTVLDGTQIGVQVKESGMMIPRKSYVCAMPLGTERATSREKCVEWQKEWTQRGRTLSRRNMN